VLISGWGSGPYSAFKHYTVGTSILPSKWCINFSTYGIRLGRVHRGFGEHSKGLAPLSTISWFKHDLPSHINTFEGSQLSGRQDRPSHGTSSGTFRGVRSAQSPHTPIRDLSGHIKTYDHSQPSGGQDWPFHGISSFYLRRPYHGLSMIFQVTSNVRSLSAFG
jgi:hypothetical protein